ncbi:hypothetical protein [Salinarimonas chemoclinalis]|uniref:hypothetical protein n=1 Tax=Salinarimonas chemoclinalis TaxID=3241599 RepID=UPI0035561278
MLLDADDWVPRDLVAVARATIDLDALGGVLAHGDMIDFGTGRTAPLPFPGVFERPFHALCGSSIVARLRPDDPDPLRRNPLHVLRDHHDWPQAAAAHGGRVVALPTRGAYLVGTTQNHSERHGPFAAWRAELNAVLRRRGRPVDDAVLARYGVDHDALRAAGGLRSAGAQGRGTRPCVARPVERVARSPAS